MNYPRMAKIRQHFDAVTLEDIPRAIHRTINECGAKQKIKSGDRVCITAGSRGIANFALIIKETVSALQEWGARPFIIPAMGSHGNATPEGQTQLLNDYGVADEYCGAPVRSQMEVVRIGELDAQVPVIMDKYAAEDADHIVVLNRIKPHTNYAGRNESGLMKMMLIGLGKQKGAGLYHRAIIERGWESIVYPVVEVHMKNKPPLFGLAVVENQLDQTAHVEAIPAARLVEREAELLDQAKNWMMRLPFKQLDVLIVDRMGKNISGAGMDTNVIGRAKPGDVKIKRIFARDLTDETHGNASGLCYADVTTTKLINRIDWPTTNMNAITSGFTESAGVPLHTPTEREALSAALDTIGLTPPHAARVCWIRDTLHLSEVFISEPLEAELAGRNDLELAGPWQEFAFDSRGELLAMS